MKIDLKPCDGTVPNPGLEFRLVSVCGKIEMGVYPVMFGARIRAGFVGCGTVELDWCMGSDQGVLTAYYHILRGYIETFEVGENPFANLPPVSHIKPVWNDPEFTAAVRSELETRTFQLEAL